MGRITIYFSIVIAYLGCGPGRPEPAEPPRPTRAPADGGPAAPDAAPPDSGLPSPETLGLDVDAVDRQADPCADFYQHACGGWIEAAPLPDGREQLGRRAGRAADRRRVLAILRQADADDPLGRFWRACNAAASGPDTDAAAPLLERIEAVEDAETLSRALGALHRHRIWAAASLSVARDIRDPDARLLYVHPRGLGLPDRARYLAREHTAERARYRRRVARGLRASGLSREAARTAADAVLTFETRLARFGTPPADVADAYHRLDRAALKQRAPNLDWGAYFDALGAEVEAVSVTDPELLGRIDRMASRTGPRRWRAYLRWHLVRSLGVPAGDDRAAECTALAREELGAALGQRFGRRVLPPEARARAAELVEAMRSALADIVADADWRDRDARATAGAKVAELTALVGWPDRVPAPPALAADAHADNVIALRVARTERALERLERGGPAPWPVTALSRDTYYDPLENRVVLPAGALRPPVFDAGRADAVDLGALALVAGHHLAHAVVGVGTEFDARGVRADWPGEDARRLARGRTCLADQYGAYRPLGDARIDGALVAGEAAADLLGARAAWRAFRERDGEAAPVRGMTIEQAFFVALGQAWCTRTSEAALRRRLESQPHAPPRYRVEGTLANLPAFAEAYGCGEDAAMRRGEVCRSFGDGDGDGDGAETGMDGGD